MGFNKWQCARITAIIVCLSVCIVIAIPLITAGYVPRNNWNINSVKTECSVDKHIINEGQCSESCNCRTSCTYTGQTNVCSRHCQTCFYTCYRGYVDIDHTVYNIVNETEMKYGRNIWIITNRWRNNVVNALNQKYPINSTLECYYASDEPIDIRLELEPHMEFLIASLVFFAFAAVIVIGGISFEIGYWVKKEFGLFMIDS